MQTNKTNFSTKGSLALIFFIMLMDVSGITILNPVAPYIVRQFSNEALMVTMITIIYAAGQFIAAPLMGKLGDRYGRRPVLLISILGQGLGYLIFGLGGSLWILFLARFIGGITGGNLSTATAYIADISKPEERSKNFTLIGMAWSLGLILGPAAGGLFGQLSLQTPAYTAAGLSLLNVLLGIFLLPESLPKDKRETAPMRVRDFNPVAAIADMARKPGLGQLLIVTSLFNFAFNGINSTSAVFFIQKFSAKLWQISALTMLAGASIALANTFLVPKWIKQFGEKTSGSYSLLGMAVVNIIIFFMPLFWPIFLLNTLISAMSSFTFPALTTLSADRVQHREVGLLMGVTTGLGSLMNVFGPLWAGLVYDHVMPGSPFWMGALILAAAGIMLAQTNRQKKPVLAEVEK
jgi:MFS transporter, DHA1 family, tetracycline resistance protein